MTNPKSKKLSCDTETFMFDGNMQLDITQMDSSKREQLSLVSSVLLSALAKGEDTSAHILIPHIKRQLAANGLDSYHDPSEIVIEAYCRTVRKINKGEIIKKPVIWLMRVSNNIILELKKANFNQKKCAARLARHETIFSEDCSLPDYTTDANVKILIESVSELDEYDYEILILKEVKGLSWMEIGEFLVESKREKLNDKKLQNRLRQRGSRALKLLRNKYEANQQLCSSILEK